MTLQERIEVLKKLGLIYDEHTRSFKGDNGKIDQDVVQYGNDKLFEKRLNKLKNDIN